MWIVKVFFLILFDFARTHGIFAFSYGIIGYSQWKSPVFLRFASFFGVTGVSFLIYFVDSVFCKFILPMNRRLILGLSVIFCIFLGVFMLYFFPGSKSNTSSIDVALIQNSSSASSHSISDFEKDAELLKRLTDNALQKFPQTELVVWGETAIVPDILYHAGNSSDSRRHALATDLLDYFMSKNCAFLIGNNHIDSLGIHNSAVFFDTQSQEIGVYNKNHLVPFTEFWPEFLDYKMFDGLKEVLNCDFFSPGKEVTIFKINNFHFASPICFEDSFPSLFRKMKSGGADFFINITDDAWSRSKAAQKMHLSMSVFRAAEFRSSVVRATIDGKTCVINSKGKIVAEIESGIDGFLCERVEIPIE